MSSARSGLERYLAFYNTARPHQAHAGQTPDMVYFNARAAVPAAA